MKEKGIIKISPGGSNSYLLKGDEGYLLVDAGMKGAAGKLRKQLNHLDIEPDDINYLVITHDHYDHTGGLEEIRKLTGAKVIIHSDELSDKSALINQSTGFFRFFVKVIGAITPEGKPEEKIRADIVMNEDMDLHELGFNARIIHTPGHSPGSVCIITDDGECIAGDTLFNMFPRTHYPIIVYDRKKLSESYRRLEDEDSHIYYPGHGEEISGELFKKRILENPKYMSL